MGDKAHGSQKETKQKETAFPMVYPVVKLIDTPDNLQCDSGAADVLFPLSVPLSFGKTLTQKYVKPEIIAWSSSHKPDIPRVRPQAQANADQAWRRRAATTSSELAVSSYVRWNGGNVIRRGIISAVHSRTNTNLEEDRAMLRTLIEEMRSGSTGKAIEAVYRFVARELGPNRVLGSSVIDVALLRETLEKIVDAVTEGSDFEMWSVETISSGQAVKDRLGREDGSNMCSSKRAARLKHP